MSPTANGITRNSHTTNPYGGIIDPITFNQMTLLSNAQTDFQRTFMQQLVDPRRSVEDECGFPPLDQNVDVNLLRILFDRNGIANRAVKVWPEECFEVQPKIYEKKNAKTPTEFEKAVDDLGGTLTHEGKSWHKNEEGSVVNEMLKRVDILSGIGKFGILLMGFNDGRNLQEPVAGSVVTLNSYEDSPPVDSNGNLTDTFTINKTTWELKYPDEKNPRQRPPQFISNTVQETIKCPPTQYERQVTANHVRLTANHRRLEGHYKRSLTCDKAWEITQNAKQSANPGNRSPATIARGNMMPGVSPAPGSMMGMGGPAPFIDGTDRQYTAGSTGATQFRDPKTGGVSASHMQPAEVKGQMAGLGMPPAALSGTDQQYFGVQYGPSEALADKPSKQGDLKLVFLRAYSEDMVQIVRYEWNIFNPRFGLPVMYRITLNDPRDMSSGGVGLPLATVFVHWSRVIHVADNRNSSEIFGAPRLRPILNNVLGLHKLYGCGPEMFWKAAFPGLSFETNPQLGGDVLIDVQALLNMYEQYQNSLQRALVTSGMTVKQLAPAVADPASQIDKQLEAICIQLEMPVRVFKGSERGELASSQDDEKWNDRVKARQCNYLTPRVVAPFYDRLIQLGVLPEPEDGYGVEWPSLDSQSASDKATIGLTKTQAIAAYAQGCEAIYPRQMWLEDIMGVDEERAEAVCDQAEKDQDDKEDDMKDKGFQPAPPDGFQHPPQPGEPGGAPKPPEPAKSAIPVKLGAGQALVHPETGKTLAKGPPSPKPAGK